MIDRPTSRRVRGLSWIAALLLAAVCGCAMPGVQKLAKPVPKPSQEEFSCGEKCPPTLREVPRM